MADGAREAVMAWLRARPGHRIRLRVRGSALSVVGVCDGLDELDACSADFSECLLKTGAAGASVSLTFHEQTLALHVLVTQPDSGEAILSLPVSMSYEDALLDEPAAKPHAVGGHTAGDQADRADRDEARVTSPYQLFHDDFRKEP